MRSAWELPEGAVLPARPVTLTGRAWSGAGRIDRVVVSLDGGETWRRTVLDRRSRQDDGWTQPLEAAHNDQGYFFDAPVRHAVLVR